MKTSEKMESKNSAGKETAIFGDQDQLESNEGR